MKNFSKIIQFIGITCLLGLLTIMVADKVKEKDWLIMQFSNPLPPNGCLALNYHRVRKDSLATKVLEFLSGAEELRYYSVYVSEFRQHIKTLKENNAVFVTPNQLRELIKNGQFPNNCVWISFDDVDQSVYENAFPILKENNIPFTLFLIAGHVGSENYENLTLASWEQIQEMVDSGLVTVGSHTYNMHRIEDEIPVFLNPKKRNDFFQDLCKSKQIIESNLSGVKVQDFAYPFGSGASELVPLIKRAGFKTASILGSQVIHAKHDPFCLTRIMVNHHIFEEIVEPWLKQTSTSLKAKRAKTDGIR